MGWGGGLVVGGGTRGTPAGGRGGARAAARAVAHSALRAAPAPHTHTALRSQQRCNSGATEVQQRCNYGATAVQQLCNSGAKAVQQRCNSGAKAVQKRCKSGATAQGRRPREGRGRVLGRRAALVEGGGTRGTPAAGRGGARRGGAVRRGPGLATIRQHTTSCSPPEGSTPPGSMQRGSTSGKEKDPLGAGHAGDAPPHLPPLASAPPRPHAPRALRRQAVAARPWRPALGPAALCCIRPGPRPGCRAARRAGSGQGLLLPPSPPLPRPGTVRAVCVCEYEWMSE